MSHTHHFKFGRRINNKIQRTFYFFRLYPILFLKFQTKVRLLKILLFFPGNRLTFHVFRMFSKSKRFNEKVSETPSPLDYDPKELKPKGSNVALVKSERFTEPKLLTPGPGHYDTSIKNKTKANQPASCPRYRDLFKNQISKDNDNMPFML